MFSADLSMPECARDKAVAVREAAKPASVAEKEKDDDEDEDVVDVEGENRSASIIAFLRCNILKERPHIKNCNQL